MKQQLRLLTKQAEESDKQSKALMVFTVVTIIFVGPSHLDGNCYFYGAVPMFFDSSADTVLHRQLPSSFLAAVFAINLDAFPWNEDGRLPLSYFLKFLCMYFTLYLGPLRINVCPTMGRR